MFPNGNEYRAPSVPPVAVFILEGYTMSKKIDVAIESIPGNKLVWDAFTETTVTHDVTYKTLTLDLGRKRLLICWRK